MGLRLVELRKTFSARGDGFVAFVEGEIGIPHSSAKRYMADVGYAPRGEYEIKPIPVLNSAPAPTPIAEPAPAWRPLPDPPEPDEPAPSLDIFAAPPRPLAAQLAPVPTRPVAATRDWTEEEREELHQRSRAEHIARIQPPKMETREERTRRLALAWGEALASIRKVRDEAGLHLTDATVSPDEFESVKRTIVSVARAALDELETAGALDAPEPRRRQLSILDGGKP
jgi:hypothetical protein